MKPYIIKSRSFSNSDARSFAKAVLGKPVAPKPVEPEFKPELVITPPMVEDPEPVVEQVVEEQVVEEPVVEEQVVEEPVVETPVVEEQIDELDEVPEPEEVVAEVSGTRLSALGLSANNVRNLKFNNINTVEELEAFVNSGKQLEALPKIGTKAEQAILEALVEWKEQDQK